MMMAVHSMVTTAVVTSLLVEQIFSKIRNSVIKDHKVKRHLLKMGFHIVLFVTMELDLLAKMMLQYHHCINVLEVSFI
jgi:hypothetical protein